jgi:hypothetical protein
MLHFCYSLFSGLLKSRFVFKTAFISGSTTLRASEGILEQSTSSYYTLWIEDLPARHEPYMDQHQDQHMGQSKNLSLEFPP